MTRSGKYPLLMRPDTWELTVVAAGPQESTYPSSFALSVQPEAYRTCSRYGTSPRP